MSPLMRTIVHHHSGTSFMVSTINRESSALLAHGSVYAETMAWEYDVPSQKPVGPILCQREGPRDSVRAHIQLAEYLYLNGEAPQ